MHYTYVCLAVVCAAAVACDAPRAAHPDTAVAAASRDPAPSLSASAVTGCYVVRTADGGPLESYSGSWAAPVHLDTSASRHPMAGSGPGRHAMRPTARIPDSAAIDTALMAATWWIDPPDTLRLTRSDGFVGQAVVLRAAGDSLVGWAYYFSDVVDSHRPPPRTPVGARRVACPLTGGAPAS